MTQSSSLAVAIRSALEECDVRAKVMSARKVARDWRAGRLAFTFDVPMPDTPGRPHAPELLPPARMPRRGKAGSERGRMALWHSLAHIEFVAIDLALDMAGRFGAQMGPGFVSDFLSVAADEAMHFVLINRHLRTMGSYYGAMAAHDGLWSAASETSHDVAARLAVVPMVLEARGLDVTPGMLERVQAAGDQRSARILQRILDDEIRHVRFGANHFAAFAKRDAQDAADLWKSLVFRYYRSNLKPPFNDSARLAAGLPRDLYAPLAHQEPKSISLSQ